MLHAIYQGCWGTVGLFAIFKDKSGEAKDSFQLINISNTRKTGTEYVV